MCGVCVQDARNDVSRPMSAASGALVAGNFPTLKTRHVLSRQNDEHVDGRANLMIEQFAGYRRMRTQNQVQMKAVRTVAICYPVPGTRYPFVLTALERVSMSTSTCVTDVSCHLISCTMRWLLFTCTVMK